MMPQLKRDMLLVLLGIFVSLVVQSAHDSIKEFDFFQGIPLVTRLGLESTIAAIGVFVILVYFYKRGEWECLGATTKEEAKKLIEADFQYVTTIEGVQLFKKRK